MKPAHEHYSRHDDCCSHPHRQPREHHEFHPLLDAMRTMCDVIETGPRLGLALLGCLNEIRHEVQPLLWPPPLSRLRDLPRTGRCGCEIPRPCWADQPLGSVCSEACPGATATLRFCITNCGNTPRTYTVDGAPTSTPATLTLGPQERGYVVVSATLPPDASCGTAKEYLVWVRGCKRHFLRWEVVASRQECCECAEVHVEDCPDLIHHWYDHFYCDRHCPKG
jgi:hypothetical protein